MAAAMSCLAADVVDGELADEPGQEQHQLAVRLLAVVDEALQQHAQRFVLLFQRVALGFQLTHPQRDFVQAALQFFDFGQGCSHDTFI
jgi:hypothetical protein